MGASTLDHREHGEHRGARDSDDLSRVTGEIIDAGLKVHHSLGPGLLESAYEHCLVHELQNRGLAVRRQIALPIVYEGLTLEAGYRLDILVEESVVVEVKAVDTLTKLHWAQVMTYLRLSGFRIGLLLNFNVTLFRDGVKRLAL